MRTPKEIGVIVRSLRGDMSLRAFSEKCEVSHTTIDNIEKGVDFRTGKPTNPSAAVLSKISKASGVSLHYILGTEDDQPRPFVAYGPDEKRLGIRGDLINVTVKGKNNAPDEMILTESERKLIELLRRVPADQKGTAMEIVNGTLTALQKK